MIGIFVLVLIGLVVTVFMLINSDKPKIKKSELNSDFFYSFKKYF